MLHARLLSYLDEVVRQGSVRKAAEHLNVAPSAISRQILILEEQLGTPLFDRSGRRLKPTAAGELLVRHVRDTIREMTRTCAQIEELKGLRRGVIRVGLMSGLAANVVPRAVSAFQERNRRVQIKLRLLPTGDRIVSGIEAGELELGVGFDFARTPGTRVLRSVKAALGAVISPNHPLAGATMLRLSDCRAFPLILPDETMAIRPYLDRALENGKLEGGSAIETNSIELMRAIALDGNTIAFLTPFDVETEQRDGRLIHVPVHELSSHTQQLMIVESARRSDVLANLFGEQLKACLTQDRPLPAS